jgi:hypothetical protein
LGHLHQGLDAGVDINALVAAWNILCVAFEDTARQGERSERKQRQGEEAERKRALKLMDRVEAFLAAAQEKTIRT